MKELKVLVCGGRDYGNRPRVFVMLDYFHKDTPFRMIVEGAATGADTHAYEWAMSRRIPCLRVPADWKKLGLKAGMARNQKMLDMVKPDLVLAFPGGAGTAGMVNLSRRMGIRTVEITDRSEASAPQSSEGSPDDGRPEPEGDEPFPPD